MSEGFNQTTRKDIRQSIGYQLGVLKVGTTTGTGETNRLIDERLTGGSLDYRGREILICNTIVRATSFDGDKAIEFRPVLAEAVPISTEYEMYRGMDITRLNKMIDEVTRDACSFFKVRYSDDSLEFDNDYDEIAIPATFVAIYKLEYESYADSGIYLEVPPNCWYINQGEDPVIKLEPEGKAMLYDGASLKLYGYRLPVVMSSDTVTTEVPPAYIKAEVLFRILSGDARGREKDKDDKRPRSTDWKREAATYVRQLKTRYANNTRWVRKI